jgi:hypothetical protein
MLAGDLGFGWWSNGSPEPKKMAGSRGSRGKVGAVVDRRWPWLEQGGAARRRSTGTGGWGRRRRRGRTSSKRGGGEDGDDKEKVGQPIWVFASGVGVLTSRALTQKSTHRALTRRSL